MAHGETPSSRAEAVATAASLREVLNHVPTGSEFEAEQPLWDEAFAEVVRQVSVHCAERGTLLEAIRTRYGEMTARLLSDLKKEERKIQQQERRAARKLEVERVRQLGEASESRLTYDGLRNAVVGSWSRVRDLLHEWDENETGLVSKATFFKAVVLFGMNTSYM